MFAMAVQRNKKSLVVILFVIIGLLAGFFYAQHSADAQRIIGAGKYRFVLGNGASFAASAQMAVANNMYLAYWTGCKFISYHPKNLCAGGYTSHPNCRYWLGGGGSSSQRQSGTRTTQSVSDVCVNIPEVQLSMPKGYRDVGGRICQSDGSMQLYCSATPLIVGPGESTTFVATPLNADGGITYTWTSNDTGTIVKSEQSFDRTTFKTQVDTIGIYRVSVRGTDSEGNTASHTCGVTVSNTPEAARKQAAQPGALPPEVSLEGGGLTNTTCPVTWTSKNTTDCALTTNAGFSQDVDASGSDDVKPGTYRLRCLAVAEIGRIVESDPIVCTRNLDIREI